MKKNKPQSITFLGAVFWNKTILDEKLYHHEFLHIGVIIRDSKLEIFNIKN